MEDELEFLNSNTVIVPKNEVVRVKTIKPKVFWEPMTTTSSGIHRPVVHILDRDYKGRVHRNSRYYYTMSAERMKNHKVECPVCNIEKGKLPFGNEVTIEEVPKG